jgi:hypothetical protein
VEEVIKENQPSEPQKDSYVKLPKWLVAVAVLLLVIVVAVGMLVAGIMLGKNQNVGVLKTVSVATPTPIATLAPTISPVAKSIPQFPVSTNPNLVRFTSEKLGVSFTYLKSQNGQTVSTKEIDDKVYVYADNTNPTNGQYLEVMPKDKNQTLEQAIKFLILNGYSTSDCPIQPATQYVPAGFEALEIVVPFNQNDTQDQIVAKSEKCPTTFTAMGGMAYFVENPNYPDKMIFLSIGQYLINSEGNNQGWQNTLQVF